jgi:hypothetical protein
MNTSEDVSVECYSGHASAQGLRAFVFDNERRRLRTVRGYTRLLRLWGTPFKALADDAATCVLAHDEAGDRWRVKHKASQSR